MIERKSFDSVLQTHAWTNGHSDVRINLPWQFEIAKQRGLLAGLGSILEVFEVQQHQCDQLIYRIILHQLAFQEVMEKYSGENRHYKMLTARVPVNRF